MLLLAVAVVVAVLVDFIAIAKRKNRFKMHLLGVLEFHTALVCIHICP